MTGRRQVNLAGLNGQTEKTARRRFRAWTQGSATASPTTLKTDKTDASEFEKEARSWPPNLPYSSRAAGRPIGTRPGILKKKQP